MFEKLGWMTIFTRIKYFQAMLMFKCMNGIAPEYLSDNLHSISDVHSYSLRSTTLHHLHVPRPKSEYFKRTFQYSGIILWNSLPVDIKMVKKLDTFKKKCSSYFLKLQYESS